MNYINKMYLKVPATSINESFVRGVVAAFCVSVNPTIEEINDLKTAISEAVTNCVVHGYKNNDGDVMVNATLYPDFLEIEITDFGVGISNTEQALQPFFTTKPDEERSGMGFTVMQAFMDELQIESYANKGTTVKMKKYFQKEAKADA